jgi:hypothetical protein
MSLLLELPEALFNRLLLQWMDLVDVGRLDSAMCSTTKRSNFLTLVSEPDFVCCKYFVPEQRIEERLDLLLKWMAQREVATSQLTVTNSWATKSSEIFIYLQRKGRYVRAVRIEKVTIPYENLKIVITDLSARCQDILHITLKVKFEVCDTQQQSELIAIIASHCHKLRELHASRGLTDADLVALGDDCPQLSNLDLLDNNVTDAGLLAVALNRALLKLCLEGCSNLTDEGLEAIARYCPQLQDLDLSACDHLTDATLIALGQHCHNLHELNVSNFNMTDAGPQAIAAGCPLLEVITLAPGDQLTDTALIALGQRCHNLRELCITDASVTHVGVAIIAKGCSRLEMLNVQRCGNVSPAVEAVARCCRGLQDFHVPDAVLSSEAALALAECCPQLMTLYADGRGDRETRNLRAGRRLSCTENRNTG